MSFRDLFLSHFLNYKHCWLFKIYIKSCLVLQGSWRKHLSRALHFSTGVNYCDVIFFFYFQTLKCFPLVSKWAFNISLAHGAWSWKQHSYVKRYGQELGALNHSPSSRCTVSNSLPHLPLPLSSQETHQSCRKLIYHTNVYLMEWVTVAGCENLKNERGLVRVNHGAHRQAQPVSACSPCCGVLRWQITVSTAASAAVGSYSHAAHETSAFSGDCGMGRHLGAWLVIKSNTASIIM